MCAQLWSFKQTWRLNTQTAPHVVNACPPHPHSAETMDQLQCT